MSDSVKIAIQRDWLVTPSFQVNCVVAIPDAVRKTLDQPVRVTDFENTAHMLMPNFVHMEIALTADRLILPMTDMSGGIWIMENVDQ